MRAALIQFDPVVGDIHGNAVRASKQARAAAAQGADLVVFPEMALCGYPPRDLLQRGGMARACLDAATHVAAEVARENPACTVLLGCVRAVQHGPRPLANSVAVLQQGRVTHWYDKQLLPTYDVFDEQRYFSPGRTPVVVRCAGMMVGICVCEDLWHAQDVDAHATYQGDPVAAAVAAGATAVAVLNASPFRYGTHARHLHILERTAARVKVPILSVNQLGGCDDLIFDGDARVVWPDGSTEGARRWEDGGTVIDLANPESSGSRAGTNATRIVGHADDMDDLWHALVLGTRAYAHRTGHPTALLGISGGIDSALVATLAVAALGARQVTGVLMPGRYSSEGATLDAQDLARRLGIQTLTLPIEQPHALLARTVEQALTGAGQAVTPLTDENMQSRLRGLQLMALSNSTGAMVLTTGNKSEYAVGYTTLYGDMCGALAPIGDVLKTQVWGLARWVNEHHARLGFAQPPIPQTSIDKVPSAELRPNQTDQDTLPPYPQLDAIVRAWVEEERSVEETIRVTGLPAELVAHWTRQIDRAEYKRFQAALILKVSARAFGPGRRMPLAQQWRPS